MWEERGEDLIMITYIPSRWIVARNGKICRESGEDHNDKFSKEKQEITDSIIVRLH